MKCYMDMHTHTIASGHAYSTLKENIEWAQQKGLKYLGLSEHGPKMPGGPHEFYLSNYICIPREYGRLHLFCGVEADICDYEGTLDIPEYIYPRLDYVIASMHVPCVTPGSTAENTRASIRAMQNPYVKILGHPDDLRFPLDYDQLVLAAKEEGVALELNNSSLHPQCGRDRTGEKITLLLNACMKYQVPILIGSDSHVCYSIGEFTAALSMIEKLSFPEELILNTQERAIERLVNCSFISDSHAC